MPLQDELNDSQRNLEVARYETESQMAEMASQNADSNFAQDLDDAFAAMKALESQAEEKQAAANEAAQILVVALERQEEVKYITFHPLPASLTFQELELIRAVTQAMGQMACRLLLC